MTIEIKKMSAGCGALVKGLDINQLSSDDMQALQQAFADFGVLFFRDQQLSCEQHIAFAQRWGSININRFFPVVDNHPQIALVRKDKQDKTNIGGGWHTDHSYDQEPAMGSILLAREIPEEGGDTLFANMYLAYEALSDGLKSTLSSLQAVHSAAHIFGRKGSVTQSEEEQQRYGNSEKAELLEKVCHPVVITHPLSGRKALYVNPAFTLRFSGWSAQDSAPLLKYLYQHGRQEAFTCRFQWHRGDIAMWDNRATWHYALNDYHGSRREMHRITIAGCALR